MEEVYVRDDDHAAGIQVVTVLKKHVGETESMQAILQLVSTNLSSYYCAMVLLTDLNSVWRFFWLQPGEIVSCTFGLNDGVALLEAIMREAQPTLPASPATPYRARCRFKDAIQRTENKIDKSSEGSTSTDQVRFSKRMKADTTDVLPRRDIADMRDVFDVMTKEEKDEWQRKQTFDFVMNVPSLQPYMTESLRSMYND